MAQEKSPWPSPGIFTGLGDMASRCPRESGQTPMTRPRSLVGVALRSLSRIRTSPTDVSQGQDAYSRRTPVSSCSRHLFITTPSTGYRLRSVMCKQRVRDAPLSVVMTLLIPFAKPPHYAVGYRSTVCLLHERCRASRTAARGTGLPETCFTTSTVSEIL